MLSAFRVVRAVPSVGRSEELAASVFGAAVAWRQDRTEGEMARKDGAASKS